MLVVPVFVVLNQVMKKYQFLNKSIWIYISGNYFGNKVSIFQEYSRNTQIQVNILPFS